MAPVLSLPPIESEFIEVDSHRVRLLTDAREAYPAMLDAIAGAKREVLFEMYWIQADSAGLRFRDALVEKAKQGVSVRVTYDALGSITAPASMWLPLIAAGGEVYEFAPISTTAGAVSAGSDQLPRPSQNLGGRWRERFHRRDEHRRRVAPPRGGRGRLAR